MVSRSLGLIGLVFLCSTPLAAGATVACTVSSNAAAVEVIDLFAFPVATSEVLRKIPVGDLVLFPDQSLAPAQAEGWTWVRHDKTQANIWQSGTFGWIAANSLTECG
ncbi:hypothetical protein [Ruegeria arenilitoris]|uniref:hypothetical protein n=1 Tax=Ruegeria arenilitoris TaxID=1173585 RepID=UPI00147B86AB|nr:hypothetical protein [Ruegeria arenilitoris]